MTKEQRIFFEKLTKDRTDSANTLEKPSMRGVKKSVVDKYSDQAHFIYELLQNADDVNATSVDFTLKEDKLIFSHNGTRHFSITDPDTEEIDAEIGKLGDLNAITSIANSSKTEASIGKFGVGFKAVFQYTKTPYIYDPSFSFKIERFIVPVILENDYQNRKSDETVFIFPFDDRIKEKKTAYEDIQIKLESLVYPVLFLKNLESITFNTNSRKGSYSKRILESFTTHDTSCEFIEFIKKNGEKIEKQFIWLFSRKMQQNKISVGFFVNANGNLIETKQTAFCFFPTKVNTNLSFIINAPFLLTDSREGIKAGVDHNKVMIQSLAELSALSLELLKNISLERRTEIFTDDNFLKIIPYNYELFNCEDERAQISFMPFYNEIKRKLKEAELIPCGVMSFVKSDNAYWAYYSNISELFSNKQLQMLLKNDSAKWILPSIGRSETARTNKVLCDYIDSFVEESYTDEKIIRLIDKDFIEKQTMNWLFDFYGFLDSDNRRRYSKYKPIFLNKERKASAAYNTDDKHILFITDSDTSDYNSLLPELLLNTKAKDLIDFYDIKEPELKDEVYSKILPKYNNLECDRDAFKKVFIYYKKCPQNEISDFEHLLKEIKFLGIKNKDIPKNLYFKSDLLVEYFIVPPNFLDMDYYRSLIDNSDFGLLETLFKNLGVNELPKKQKKIIGTFGWQEINQRGLFIPVDSGYRDKTYTEYYFEGLNEIIQYIIENKNRNKSVALWKVMNSLCNKFYSKHCSLWPGNEFIIGKCEFFYRSQKCVPYNTDLVNSLHDGQWLLNKDGVFSAPSSIYQEQVADIYISGENDYSLLFDFLKLTTEPKHEEDTKKRNDNLTDEQKRKIELADKIEKLGITDEEIQEILIRRSQKESNLLKKSDENLNRNKSENKDLDRIFKEIEKRTTNNRNLNSHKNDTVAPQNSNVSIEDEIDGDEFLPKEVNFSDKIDKAKEKSAEEVGKILLYEKLMNNALTSKKYTYKWFSTLLQLEMLSNTDSNIYSHEIAISFGHVDIEGGKYLVLSQPNKDIPQIIEEITDIPLTLRMNGNEKIVIIDMVTIQSYRIKVRIKEDISTLNISEVTDAFINTKRPEFLLNELQNKFAGLGFADDYDMRANLCHNIEFIFGPPGTGKSTYIVNKIVIPLIQYRDVNILILTPTNKAADVITKKIMEVISENDYSQWLVRFGITNDEKIKESNIFRDKRFNIQKLKKNVTITTIARFPYDYFIQDDNTHIFISEKKWDYIIFDEASMISLISIIYPLYKKTPEKFYIAGDPFQIEPITSIDRWKNENIYSLVELNSFKNPTTTPIQYKIVSLNTQYRSLPCIGEIYSGLTYNFLLHHFRDNRTQKKVFLRDKYDICNIIKFPVSSYESIYRAKRLGKTPYHIYSAIFCYEFVKHLVKIELRDDVDASIGIIAPYRAQADLIQKLLYPLILEGYREINIGTIHSFQGDECDILISVFNPPIHISSNKDLFLNNRNIINVSLSRAKDYLFILMPDSNTQGINSLFLLNKVEELCLKSGHCKEFSSHDIEKYIFNNPNYIDENSFSSGHKNVNVYRRPEKKYEIRSEQSAIDIQIYDKEKNESSAID